MSEADVCVSLSSGPYVEIDMRPGEVDGYDAVFLSPHKFVGGPGTPGILLMSRSLYRLSSQPPTTCGGGTVAYVNGASERDTVYLAGVEGGGRRHAAHRRQGPRRARVLGQGARRPRRRRRAPGARPRRRRHGVAAGNPNVEVLGNVAARASPSSPSSSSPATATTGGCRCTGGSWRGY